MSGEDPQVFTKQLISLVLQHLDEEKYKETVHTLERESASFFDINYLEELVLNGNLDDAEKYVEGFVNSDASKCCWVKILELLWTQKYLEALIKDDLVGAVDILVFLDKKLKETLPLTEHILSNFDATISDCRNIENARKKLMTLIKEHIEEDPVQSDKLKSPLVEKSRLKTLLEQSLRWQYFHCGTDSHPDPTEMITLLKDHSCRNSSGLERASGSNVATTSNNVALRALQTHDLPKDVLRTLNIESNPTSMDFHPIHHKLFLAGTNLGEIRLWDLCKMAMLFARKFQTKLVEDPSAAVTRIVWNSKGSLFGVAYSKGICQLYSYHVTSNDVRLHLEFEAHFGSVNDLAFCDPKGIPKGKYHYLLTCGDDKTIKLWDADTGEKVRSFEGHDSAVHSVCTHWNKKHLFFSTSVDGKIETWIYKIKTRMMQQIDAPGGKSCTKMIFNADASRLFSCGTNEEGQSHIVEWNKQGTTIQRVYNGLHERSSDLIQFDMTKNKFLAAGHNHLIKFWDIDNANLLASTDAGGGLPACPQIRFNKDGTLLAVSAGEDKIKFLATLDGQRLLGEKKVS